LRAARISCTSDQSSSDSPCESSKSDSHSWSSSRRWLCCGAYKYMHPKIMPQSRRWSFSRFQVVIRVVQRWPSAMHDWITGTNKYLPC
jgi:predicted alpha/beta hydrolase